MVTLARWRAFFFPPARTVAIRSVYEPGDVRWRLVASLRGVPAGWSVRPRFGTVVGRMRDDGRLDAWVYAGRNSWRPVLTARVERDPAGGSVVRGSIASSTAVNIFSLVWLAGATVLSTILLAAGIVGAVTGLPMIRGGDGEYLSGPTAFLLTAGTFALFVGAGIGLPFAARRMTATDADRLVEFLVVTLRGEVVAG